jgi:hypothetical protein
MRLGQHDRELAAAAERLFALRQAVFIRRVIWEQLIELLLIILFLVFQAALEPVKAGVGLLKLAVGLQLLGPFLVESR